MQQGQAGSGRVRRLAQGSGQLAVRLVILGSQPVSARVWAELPVRANSAAVSSPFSDLLVCTPCVSWMCLLSPETACTARSTGLQPGRLHEDTGHWADMPFVSGAQPSLALEVLGLVPP